MNASVLSIIPDKYPKVLPKAVLFDWDNTLVDTMQVGFDALNEALVGLGRPLMSLEEYGSSPHLSIRDAGPTLFGHDAERGEQLFYQAIERFHEAEIKAFTGVENLLSHLNDREVYVAVVSNKDGPVLRKEVNRLGWGPHFKSIVGSRDALADKPSHLPVLAALEKAKLDPSHDVWFVGDSLIDVLCAKASGCVPIVVGHGVACKEDDIVHAKDAESLMTLLLHL